MTTATAVDIDADGLHYRTLNDKVHAAIAGGATEIVLKNVRGQRYIGAGLTGDLTVSIEGVPGNDLACFMNGPRVVVHGNAQDGVANTMTSGSVVVHGDVGDVLAYGMRGGTVHIRGNAGYRLGIHMKAYRDLMPAIVLGGAARDYLGEYMAGGILVVLGLDGNGSKRLAGEYVGTGMHGGQIFLRGRVDDWQLGREVGRLEIDPDAWKILSGHLAAFGREFGTDLSRLGPQDFTRLAPVSHRPYGKVYVY
jgi:glutamate synthase domain-containing protein 3